MKKCEAKVNGISPGLVWGTKKIEKDCPKNAKGEGNFCEVHGCFDCSLKSVETCSEYEGVKLCLACLGKRGFKKNEEKERKKKIIEEARKAFKKQKEEEKERLQKEAEKK